MHSWSHQFEKAFLETINDPAAQQECQLEWSVVVVDITILATNSSSCSSNHSSSSCMPWSKAAFVSHASPSVVPTAAAILAGDQRQFYVSNTTLSLPEFQKMENRGWAIPFPDCPLDLVGNSFSGVWHASSMASSGKQNVQTLLTVGLKSKFTPHYSNAWLLL
jgi:hypothetical protein